MRIYYATYIFHDPNIMAILSISTLLPTILGLLIAPKFSEKVGIKNSIIIGLIISIISYVVMSVFSESLPFLIIGLIINGIGIVPFTAALSGIVADVGDIIYWKTGVPVQGSIFSLKCWNEDRLRIAVRNCWMVTVIRWICCRGISSN